MNRSMTAWITGVGALLSLGGSAVVGQVLGNHDRMWWDDPNFGVLSNPRNLPPPTPQSMPLFRMTEWHLSQAATQAWYNGLPIPGLPLNPFNAANRNGMTVGSAIVPVNNAEAFIYEVTNLGYFNGNGPPPFQAPPYTFTTPPGMLGQNDLSGINIIDTHGALQLALPVAGSQFMFSHNLVVGSILDLTPASAGIPASQDWDFNAYTGPGNWEWDIDTAGVGASMALPSIVFGYAMPGNWLDALNDGHAHSWNMPAGAAPFQVNVAFANQGWSGPMIPAPTAGLALAIGAAGLLRRR